MCVVLFHTPPGGGLKDDGDDGREDISQPFHYILKEGTGFFHLVPFVSFSSSILSLLMILPDFIDSFGLVL